MWAMSDRAIPRSLRMIEGFGIHSFRLLDDDGNSTFVKFHWRPKLGIQSTVWDEAVKLQAADNDFHRRDLFEAIESGDFPEWELAVQLFTQEEADAFPFDHLDPTKLIPEELVPLTVIGTHGAGSLAGQLLRRDRAGRLLPGEHRAGHRFQQRSAAAGTPVLLPGHAAVAAGRAQLPPDPDQRAEVPVRQPCSATATCRCGCPRVAWTTSRVRCRPIPRAKSQAGFRSHRHARPTTAPRAASVQKASPTTTARRGCSSAARPGRSRRTLPRRWCSNYPRWTHRMCAKPSSATCATSMRRLPSASPMALAWRHCPGPARPRCRHRT